MNRVIVRCRPHGFTAPYSLIKLTAKPLASYFRVSGPCTSTVFGSSHASRSRGSRSGETRLAEVSAKIGKTLSLQQMYRTKMQIFLMAMVILIFLPVIKVLTFAP